MLTLAALAVAEFYLALLPDTAVQGDVSSGLFVLLLMCLLATSFSDTRGAYIPTLCYALAVGWYASSIPRWLPALDGFYQGASPQVGFALAAVALVIVPLALLATPLVHAAVRYYNRDHS